MKRIVLLIIYVAFIQHNWAQKRTTVRAIEVDSSFDHVSRTKLQQSVKILDSIFNSKAFEEQVLKANLKIGNHNLSNNQILELIRSGADNYRNKPADYSIDIRVKVFDDYYGHNNFGVTNMETRITGTHRCYILESDIKCYVSHLAHEYMHQIGFTDDRSWALGTKTKSVPYKIGNIVNELIGNKSKCLAIDKSCPK